MTGHEARVNNVMDDGRKLIDEGNHFWKLFKIFLRSDTFDRTCLIFYSMSVIIDHFRKDDIQEKMDELETQWMQLKVVLH